MCRSPSPEPRFRGRFAKRIGELIHRRAESPKFPGIAFNRVQSDPSNQDLSHSQRVACALGLGSEERFMEITDIR
jgi:hypothetical protein